jgi:hypothetical protein
MMDYREQLQARRETQRVLYARFRDTAAMLMQQGLVKYNKDKHRFEPISEYYYGSLRIPKLKVREILKQFVELRSNIEQQAMLMLEMEHAINTEEKKNANNI